MDESRDKSPRVRRWLRVLATLFLAFLVLGLVLPSVGGRHFFHIVEVLVTGWYRFMVRTIPQITWNWDLVGMAVLGTALGVAGLHWFFSSLWRRKEAVEATSREGAGPRIWRWRWTWCSAAALGLLFVTGSAIVGAVHQIGWIRASPGSMMEVKGRRNAIVGMKILEMTMQIAQLESKNDVPALRHALRDEAHEAGLFVRDKWILDRIRLLVIQGKGGVLRGYLIFPRQQDEQSRYGGVYSLDNTRKEVTHEQIRELIARHREELVSM